MAGHQAVTLSGWYEHTNGTWGRYGWGVDGLSLRETVEADAPRPTEAERIERAAADEAATRRAREVAS